MGNKCQEERIDRLEEAQAMIVQIKTTIQNTHATLLQDAIGAAALMVMLVAALHLPGLP